MAATEIEKRQYNALKGILGEHCVEAIVDIDPFIDPLHPEEYISEILYMAERLTNNETRSFSEGNNIKR